MILPFGINTPRFFPHTHTKKKTSTNVSTRPVRFEMEAQASTTKESAWGSIPPAVTKKDVIDEMAIEYMARRMVDGLPISMKEYNEETKAKWTVRQMVVFTKSRPSRTINEEFLDILRRKVHKISNGLVALRITESSHRGGGFAFQLFKRNSQEEPFVLEVDNYGSSSSSSSDDEEEEDGKEKPFTNSLKIDISYTGKDDSDPRFKYRRGKQFSM